MLVDQLDDPREHVGIGLGQHAVAEVEDVPGVAAVAPQHVADLVGDDRPRRAEHRRVEVALQRRGRPDPAPGLVERDPPVDADHVGAGVAHQREELAGADAEVDAGHAEVGDALEAPPRLAGSTNRS